MKSNLIVLALTLALCRAVQASVYTFDFTGINTAVPDGNFNGLVDQRTVSGLSDRSGALQITDVNVSLNLSGGYNGDIYAYLVHNSGFAVLLNRVGKTGSDNFGYDNTGFAITLDDGAGSDVHLYQTVAFNLNGGGQLTGTWNPDGRAVDPNDVVDTSSRTALLESFNGGDPNGTWTLFLADTVGGEQSTLDSWQLQISAVPEPVTWGLILFGVSAVTIHLVLKRWKVRKQKKHRCSFTLYYPTV